MIVEKLMGRNKWIYVDFDGFEYAIGYKDIFSTYESAMERIIEIFIFSFQFLIKRSPG